ncbi:uncharacterized protein LOC122972555 [Thunnus albacares]|uniref:uncharacterized protein LOC122972555 n=1 Tax=Thunnus albacares TaxID=8236 RepID=UPI001CF64475|nr:uncharacterized protein LOC122972555 [Thunnus albacares]
MFAWVCAGCSGFLPSSKTGMLGLIFLSVPLMKALAKNKRFTGPSDDPAETKLKSVREQFIAGVSEPNLRKLLDKLLQRGVINNDEMEFARTLNRAEKTRQVIDMVRRKGTEASSALIAALCEVDPCLSSELESGPSTSNRTLNVSEDNREDQLDPCVIDQTQVPPEDFRPEVLTESANISYRFNCPGPGVFRCTLTGLVFVMTQEAELRYRTVQWDESHLQQVDKMAAGPLFNIQSPDGAVSQLQLPHCETMDAPLPEGLLSVAHIADDGMSILEPLEITDTHVVVNVPHLSAFGLLWKLVRFLKIPIEIRGQVLLFLRPLDKHLQKLNVFLLPGNVDLDKVKAKQKADHIEISSNCRLITNRSYSVHCKEASRIQPEVLLHLPGPGPAETPSDPAETKLMSVREQFIARVSEANLNKLLDKLLQRGVINNGEMEFAGTPTRADKARQVIDMVLGKGRDASSVLIAALREVDKFLSTELNLQ